MEHEERSASWRSGKARQYDQEGFGDVLLELEDGFMLVAHRPVITNSGEVAALLTTESKFGGYGSTILIPRNKIGQAILQCQAFRGSRVSFLPEDRYEALSHYQSADAWADPVAEDEDFQDDGPARP